MNIRYMYGKKKFLKPVIRGEKGIRLSDLSHYSRMENEEMRDNEMEKKFTLDRYLYPIHINDTQINPDNMTSDPYFTLFPRHCYCVCFTRRGNDHELYNKFQADICIAFDVEKLQERLALLSERFPGIYFQGKDIIYYHPGTPPGTFLPDELVFVKPHCFIHEAEYRIALFYPLNKRGFATKEGRDIPFRIDGESMHMEVGHIEPGFIRDCVIDVFYP
ncbi:hypothetical protein Q3V30_22580 (plasmid) [Erwinia pyri]|uniref:Uncharacterized protein n=1 Tax=Erwinia pyri TaxID=3062598 RepID=A0AA50DP03_9GAMM|nr:hypothetical protein [Erwinia sp. DE2]WLS81252.1 hypothetical protein Q3V30_22580 [Erwinia sp. DE2]